MKRAQNISINVIIVAAIALIVLVVLVAVFTGRFGAFTSGLNEMGNPAKSCSQDDQGFYVYETKGECMEGDLTVLAKTSAGMVCCTKS